MTKTTTTPAATEDSASANERQMKRRLLLRASMAALLILALLGGLALYDSVDKAPDTRSLPGKSTARTAPPSQLAKSEAPLVPPLAAIPEDALADAPPETEDATAELGATAGAADATSAPQPESAAPLVADAPPPLPPLVRPALRPLTKPATARPAMLHPAQTHAAAPLAPPAMAIPLPQQAAPAPRLAPSRPPRMDAPVLLQLGVFSNLTRAEELRAKLELNGIPAQIEARVQVGPFASRAEAEATRRKLRELGMDEGMLVAARK